jgi:hypothetical protein
VALELAHDGREREARERQPASGIEPVDRLEQADRGHLPQVVEVVGALVTPREVVRERQEALHERRAGRGRAGVGEALEERVVLGAAVRGCGVVCRGEGAGHHAPPRRNRRHLAGPGMGGTSEPQWSGRGSQNAMPGPDLALMPTATHRGP